MKEYTFYDTTLGLCIENAFQALALDEHRPPFAPAVWEKPRGSTTVSCSQLMCCFAIPLPRPHGNQELITRINLESQASLVSRYLSPRTISLLHFPALTFTSFADSFTP